ncbi:MAG: sugar-binding domain-containing protein, partial [Bacteroidota bacterium]
MERIRSFRFLVWLFICTPLHSLFAQPNLNAWQDQRAIGFQKLPARATFIPLASDQELDSNNYLASSRVQILNGTWEFILLDHPDQIPWTTIANQTPSAQLVKYKSGNIEVPGNWQLQGYGRPTYHNIVPPYKAEPPYILEEQNETGWYRRTFTLDQGVQQEAITLHLAGVQSACYVYLNGQYIGYSEGSMTPAEFDVTSSISRDGENLLDIIVIRWSDGSYLEDQDFWRISGLHRDVYLIGRPTAYLQDYTATPALDENYLDGTLQVAGILRLAQMADEQKGKIKLQVYESAGDTLETHTAVFTLEKGQATQSFTHTFKLPNAKKWTAETPHLYGLKIQIEDEQGKVLELIHRKVGIREVTIANGQLRVNGKPILLQGVNRHEFDPIKGRTVMEADMMADIM